MSPPLALVGPRDRMTGPRTSSLASTSSPCAPRERSASAGAACTCTLAVSCPHSRHLLQQHQGTLGAGRCGRAMWAPTSTWARSAGRSSRASRCVHLAAAHRAGARLTGPTGLAPCPAGAAAVAGHPAAGLVAGLFWHAAGGGPAPAGHRQGGAGARHARRCARGWPPGGWPWSCAPGQPAAARRRMLPAAALSFPLSVVWALRQMLVVDKDFKDVFFTGSKVRGALRLERCRRSTWRVRWSYAVFALAGCGPAEAHNPGPGLRGARRGAHPPPRAQLLGRDRPLPGDVSRLTLASARHAHTAVCTKHHDGGRGHAGGT